MNVQMPLLADVNRGYLHERTHSNLLEASFANLWEKENEPKPWINQGHGLLQNLFITPNHYCVHQITSFERYVAATVIQWLGTNCGFAFLQQALKSAGYKIVEIEDDPEPPKPKPPPNPYSKRRLQLNATQESHPDEIKA